MLSGNRISGLLLVAAGIAGAVAVAQTSSQIAPMVTHVEVTDSVLRTDVRRMGVNLGEQTYYDSGQMLKNLVARNPGFEGMEYRSIVRCGNVGGGGCVTEDGVDAWPAGFWNGAQCEWLDAGANPGPCSVAVSAKAGKTLSLRLVGAGHGNYLILRKTFPGDATAGWWPEVTQGATLTAESKDLSAKSEGHQALRMDAAGTGQVAAVMSYFDSTAGRTFLRMHGRYQLRFRAKAVAGTKSIGVSVTRLSMPAEEFYARSVVLGDGWQDFSLEFAANDAAEAIGAVRLRFEAAGSVVLLDDVSLEKIDGDAGNTTAFREEVVAALRELHPGVLRYMASSTELGASIGNLLAPVGARMRSGYSVWSARQEEIPVGLPEFLALCRAVGAEPWIVVPAATSVGEMRQLVGYLAKETFATIHLELGNEVWNGIFRGATIEDAAAYGARAGELFAAARGAPGYAAGRFDLIVGGQVDAFDRNRTILGAAGGALAIAPYLMHSVNDDSSVEKIFGPLLAEPEMMEMRGVVWQNRQLAGHAGLAVYEVNLHTTEGSLSQQALDRLTPSMGAGLALADHMLLMLREDDVRTQALFSLAGYENRRVDGKHVLLWGAVLDMGVTNRRRPQFLAVEMLNQALLRTMVATRLSGRDPVWMQPPGNDGVALDKAHVLQSFAFQDGAERSLILLNLSREEQLEVDFSGLHAPKGKVTISTLSANAITDTNEESEKVRIRRSEVSSFDPAKVYSLAPASMTILRWTIR